MSTRVGSIVALLVGCGAAAPPPVPPAQSAAAAHQECPPLRASKPVNDDETLRTVDARASLALYEQLVLQDPSDPELLWQLALAYESQERWDAAATTFARAAVLAPEQARYWYRSGRAWLQQGAAGDEEAWETAREPLEKCIELRPSDARCQFLLGEAEEFSDREQQAAEHYEQAVLRDPTKPRYYLRLAELYASFRRDPEAEKVLSEGVRLVPASPENDPDRCVLFVKLAQAARLRHDEAAELAALGSAELLADAASPQVLFELGASYAVLDAPVKLSEPRNQKAVTLLSRFVKRVCRGAHALDFRDQCEHANQLLQRLGQ
jgi:tetratricopeptide (TPR) repeat protein